MAGFDRRERGFSMVEMVSVIILAAVASAVILPRWFDSSRYRLFVAKIEFIDMTRLAQQSMQWKSDEFPILDPSTACAPIQCTNPLEFEDPVRIQLVLDHVNETLSAWQGKTPANCGEEMVGDATYPLEKLRSHRMQPLITYPLRDPGASPGQGVIQFGPDGNLECACVRPTGSTLCSGTVLQKVEWDGLPPAAGQPGDDIYDDFCVEPSGFAHRADGGECFP